ncbi:MAG: hypothetical protein WBR09_05395, partial [Serratia proteamaculans]
TRGFSLSIPCVCSGRKIQSTHAQYIHLTPGFSGPFLVKSRICATLRKALQHPENTKDKGPAMLSL